MNVNQTLFFIIYVMQRFCLSLFDVLVLGPFQFLSVNLPVVVYFVILLLFSLRYT